MNTVNQTAEQQERATPMKSRWSFTPGEWKIADYGAYSHSNNEGDVDRLTVYVERAETADTCENPDICRVYQIDGDRSKAKFANARLIAAAPKLVVLLEELETWATARDNTMGDPSRSIECQAHVRDAAERARGLLAAIEKGE